MEIEDAFEEVGSFLSFLFLAFVDVAARCRSGRSRKNDAAVMGNK